MSQKKVMKCPECGGEMERGSRLTGYLTIAVRFTKEWDWKGDMIIPFYCKNCGYIKLYKEMKKKKKFLIVISVGLGTPTHYQPILSLPLGI